MTTGCSFNSGGDCILALPTPCGGCASDTAGYCVHPETGETFDPEAIKAASTAE